MRKTREQLRNERAEAVCRELRWQIAKYGKVEEIEKVYKMVCKWMKVAKVNKYLRP